MYLLYLPLSCLGSLLKIKVNKITDVIYLNITFWTDIIFKQLTFHFVLKERLVDLLAIVMSYFTTLDYYIISFLVPTSSFLLGNQQASAS